MEIILEDIGIIIILLVIIIVLLINKKRNKNKYLSDFNNSHEKEGISLKVCFVVTFILAVITYLSWK